MRISKWPPAITRLNIPGPCVWFGDLQGYSWEELGRCLAWHWISFGPDVIRSCSAQLSSSHGSGLPLLNSWAWSATYWKGMLSMEQPLSHFKCMVYPRRQRENLARNGDLTLTRMQKLDVCMPHSPRGVWCGSYMLMETPLGRFNWPFVITRLIVHFTLLSHVLIWWFGDTECLF